MSTAAERQEILELVASGKMSASEAAAALSGGGAEGQAAPSPEPQKASGIEVEEVVKAPTNGDRKTSWLHVRVSDLNTGKRKVTVNIPLRLMKLGIRLGSAFAPELKDIDVDELSQALESDSRGILIDVEDEEDGNHVQVYVD